MERGMGFPAAPSIAHPQPSAQLATGVYVRLMQNSITERFHPTRDVHCQRLFPRWESTLMSDLGHQGHTYYLVL